jgi:hypothetical protein
MCFPWCSRTLQLIPTRPRRCTMRAMNTRSDNSSVNGQAAQRTGVCGIACPAGGGGARRSPARHSSLEKVHWTFSPPGRGSLLIHQNNAPAAPWLLVLLRAAARAPKSGTGRCGTAPVGQGGGSPNFMRDFPAQSLAFAPRTCGTARRAQGRRLLFPHIRRMDCGRTARRSATRPARPRAWPSISFDPVVFAACHAVARA